VKQRDLILYGVIAAVGYWLYTKFYAGASAVANVVAQPIANAYVALTSGAAPVPQGSVVFPDGSYLPVANIAPTWYGSALVFTYNGQNWQLQPQVNGNYPAIPYVAA